MCTADPMTTRTALRHPDPAQRIADILFNESGKYINPDVLRLIVKYRWAELAEAAHELHGSAK